MACGKSKNNVVLISLGLLFFGLGSCTISKKQKIQEYSISSNRNRHWRHGKLLIGFKAEPDGKLKEETDIIDLNYQSDMAWDVHEQKMVEHGFPEYDKTAVERILKMNPTVNCSGGQMRLQVTDSDSKPGALLFVDRGHLPPLSLSKLPKSCGYKVSSTHHNFVMIAPFDGCFVLVTEFCYVLPLRWFGLPVQMTCPVDVHSIISGSYSDSTPMVTCHPGGMVIKTEWRSALSEIKVKLRNKWEPLTQVSAICNVDAVKPSEGMITMSFPYQPPCVEKKDGMYIVKMSGDVDMEVTCPPTPLTPSGFPQFVGQFGEPTAPTHYTKPTPSAPSFDLPQTPSHSGYQFDSWYGKQPSQHVSNGVGQSRYPMPPGFNYNWGQVSISHPDVPSINVFDQGPGYSLQPGNPSVGVPPFENPELYWPPFLPNEPVKPEIPAQPTEPLKPEGSPTYPCPFHYTTEKPEAIITATSSPVTGPQRYHLHGPYYHPYLIPHLPHSTPTPSLQKTQDPTISSPGMAVVFPEHPHLEMKQTVECLQYCQVGLLLECCPQIAIHQHHYHFVPQQQNGNFHSPVFPLPGHSIGSRTDSHALSPGPQVSSVPTNYPTVTKAPLSPEFYQLGGLKGSQTYHRPQEGSPAALPENKPMEQTDVSPAFFDPDTYFSHNFNVNSRNPQAQPEGRSAGAPPQYHNFFDSAQPPNLYDPYNVPVSHQSDGPTPNIQLTQPLSSVASKSANHANINKESAMIFGSQEIHQLSPYDTVQKHFSNHQHSDPLRSTQREYVLLQESPPSRESEYTVPSQQIKDQYFVANFPKESLNLKDDTEDSKRSSKENSGNTDQTTGEKTESQQQFFHAGSTSARLSQDQNSRQYFRYPRDPLSRFDGQRTLQQDVS